MSDEFEGLDASEKAGIERALNRCRALAAKIANELRNKTPEHSLTSCRWRTFTTPLSTLPMSSDKADRRLRTHLLPRRRVRRRGIVSSTDN